MIDEPAFLFGSAAARDTLRVEAEAFVSRAITMIRRSRLLVFDDRAGAIELLTARRASLGEHFGRYQRFKHGSIFDPVISHGSASSRVVARTMKLDCMELGEAFGAYHARWLGMTTPDWSAYRQDMLATADMLTGNLEAELRAIRQLLMISDLYDRHGSGPRPAPATATSATLV